jgi:tRNA(His) 5'-end guanylyltransferase
MKYKFTSDLLGSRMKNNYESVAKTRLVRRMPVAIRIDGKAFHTFTKGFQKPFDKVLGNAMIATMEYLCENIQGAVFGYTQSDEITLILVDYTNLETQAWFDYEVQKICSVSASMATMAFNQFFMKEAVDFKYEHTTYDENLGFITDYWDSADNKILYQNYSNKFRKAMFDARCFNIPKEEVANLVYWRQIDAVRNSVQMVGQANFSHSELQNKSCNQIRDMLANEKDIDWSNYPTRWKHGVAWVKGKGLDYEMPTIKGEGRDYIENLIYIEGDVRIPGPVIVEPSTPAPQKPTSFANIYGNNADSSTSKAKSMSIDENGNVIFV